MLIQAPFGFTFDPASDPRSVGAVGEVQLSNGAGLLMSDPRFAFNGGQLILGAGLPAVDSMFTIALPAAQNIVIDARTAKRQFAGGALRFLYTPNQQGTRALHFDIDANGFADTHATVVDFKATGMQAGAVGAINAVTLDTANSTGGGLAAHLITRIGAGAATITALQTHHGVEPLLQRVGAPIAFAKAWASTNGTSFLDRTAHFNDPALNLGILTVVNDAIYVGLATKFTGIEFILATPGTKDVRPTFAYSNGTGGWTPFGPTDGTDAFRSSGEIAWDIANTTGWTADTISLAGPFFWVRIQRTFPGAAGPIVESTIRAVNPVEYGWDKTAAVRLRTLRFDTTDSSASPGNKTHSTAHGSVAIAAGTATVVVTNSLLTSASVVNCSIAGAAEDTTLKDIRWRVAAGTLTITGNANATLATRVNYSIAN